jgi:hypothetical protein
MAEQGRSSAEQVQEQAKEKAQEATEKARHGLRDQVDSRSTQAGEQISKQAGDMRSLSQELRNQGKEGPAKMAEQAADRADKVGGYLTGSDADRILRDAEHMARSNPWAVMVGGLAAGFLASRFLKASSSDRYHGRTAYDRRQIVTGEPSDRFARPTTSTGTAPSAPPPAAPPVEPRVGGTPASGSATTGAL